MLEQHSQEMQQQLRACRKELEETQSKLAKSISQETALVQQNARTSMQLTSEEKRRRELETAVEQLKGKLGCTDESRRQLEETNKKRKAEQESLQTQLEEKTTTLREYQAKVSYQGDGSDNNYDWMLS